MDINHAGSTANSHPAAVFNFVYPGSFIGYLFKTLEYAGRGLRPLEAYSLDDHLYSGERRRADRVALHPETAEIVIYGRS